MERNWYGPCTNTSPREKSKTKRSTTRKPAKKMVPVDEDSDKGEGEYPS